MPERLGWKPRNSEEEVWDYDLGGMVAVDELGWEGFDKNGNCIFVGDRTAHHFNEAMHRVERAAAPRPWMEGEGPERRG